MVSEAPWDIYRAVRPILILSRASGLAPVRIAPGGAGGLLPSKGAIVWASCLCLILIASIVIYLMFLLASVTYMEEHLDTVTLNETSMNHIDFTKIAFTGGIQVVLSYVSCVCAVIANTVLLRHRLGPLLASLAATDLSLVADRTTLYRRTRTYLLLLLICITLIYAAYFAYDLLITEYVEEFDFFEWLLYCLVAYPFIIRFILDIQIWFAVLGLRNRFCRVNAYFEALLNECRTRNRMSDSFRNGSCSETQKNGYEGQKRLDGPVILDEKLCEEVFRDVFHGTSTSHYDKTFSNDSSCIPPDLNTLFRVHDTLCEGLQQLSDMFGIQMLVEIMSVFVNIISSVFSAVKFGIVFVVHALLLDVATLIAFSVSGFHCTTQANNTATLVSRLLLQRTSPGARRLLARFASQLLHARTRICACGLLVLDSELLAQMTGAIATYTVILVQYKGAHTIASSPDANATVPANVSEEGLWANATLDVVHGFSNHTLSLGSA